MNKGGRYLSDVTKQLFDVVEYFKNKHPHKISCNEVAQAFNLPKRTCQRTLQSYVKGGWIRGDNESPQGFRLSLQACRLLHIDPLKDPLEGLSSSTKGHRNVPAKYQGIHI